ncbi:MAG: hypothetical protein MUP17_06990 [candidate division Zixibacteria bacterium]|nr:hypothetical protein [candidate division Zixibacteria bacterium]
MRGVKRILRKSWIGWLIIFYLALGIGAFVHSANFPCQPSGKVYYKGKLVPDGRKVMAYIQGVKYDEKEVRGGAYTLSIPADDPSTAAKEGWEDQEFVSLKVEGYSGATTFQISSNDLTPQIDINLTTMGVLNLTTWGKIKALFK